MKSNKSGVSYPLGDQKPAAGQLQQMAEGVYWLRMPLPFALDHINLWLLEDEIEGRKGWTLVDTGIARPEVQALWQQIEAEQLQGLPILRVVVTHMHPDHVGLAQWLCTRWQAPLYMSLSDYALACLWAQPTTQGDEALGATGGEAAAQHFARHGLVDAEAQLQIKRRSSYYADLVQVPPAQFHRLMHNAVLSIGGRQWRCIAGYGHAPEHMALFCEELNVLISGDMVLPTISTNVSVFAYEPEADPLTLYLDSLRLYLALPIDTLVLPSHGRPFLGLHDRVHYLQEHHTQRLAETLEACQGPDGCSAAELIPVLFKRQLDMHQLTFAMGEAIAHLHRLYFQGLISRRVDTQGVYKFYATLGE